MATQAEEDENSQCEFVIPRCGIENSRCGFRNPPRGFQKLGHVGFHKTHGLFRLKDGLGPCLKEANITQHLPLHGEFQGQMRHLYSGAGGYKSERGEGSASQSATERCSSNTSCEEQEEDPEADHSNPL